MKETVGFGIVKPSKSWDGRKGPLVIAGIFVLFVIVIIIERVFS